MVNEIYLYLRDQFEHAESCTERRCAPSCKVAQFDAQLEEPLLLADVQAAAVAKERLAALMRGEIPQAG